VRRECGLTLRRMVKYPCIVGFAAALVALTAIPAVADIGTIRLAGTPDAVAGSYIVALKENAQTGTMGTVDFVYPSINGYAATMTERQARRLAADPQVAYVEQNQRVKALDTQPNPPSWGLDRIDQRDLPMDQTYNHSTTAANVNAYIIDTGIRVTHQDFGGRAKHGRDTIDNDNDATDCNGHGTHVAGTVGGNLHGVAKAVTLHAVRVLNCQGSGTNATVVAGIDWVTRNAVKPAVANMSLGGSASTAIDDAVRRSTAAGITHAVAAGNSNDDACRYSPARAPDAITVGATYLDDGKAGFSSFGRCLDIFAPGVGIRSATSASDTSTASFSGTSMASPHVAGTAALYLAKNPSATPKRVRDALVNVATPGKVTNAGSGSPNKLLFTDSGIAPPEPPPGCGKRTNDGDVPLPDAGVAVGTAIRYAKCAGNAPADLKVEVHVKHPFRGDVRVDLVSPDGTEFRLKDSSSVDGKDDIDETFTVNASGESRDGAWVLKVQDRSEGDTGFLDSWSLTMP
jgi:subtilisin family serine protease